ncbi:MAG: hypothetical protein M3Z54_07615 [Gemmatimonadota bacterium]|nr:hypothetical protein [Gemmatimonadota bacterium]
MISAQAADDSADRETLRGIPAFHALAVVNAPDGSSAKAMESSLQTLVELCLRRDGIGVTDGPGSGPFVVFTVRALLAKGVQSGVDLGYAATWDFEVRQIVRTLRGATNYVATWHWGNYGVGPTNTLERVLTTNLEDGCAKFSNAWLMVNPKSH